LALSDNQALSKPRIPTGPNVGSEWGWYHEVLRALTNGSPRQRGSSGKVGTGRTSSVEDGGPTLRGESRNHRGGEPAPSPSAHLAGQQGRFEVRGAPAVNPSIAEPARARAQPHARPRGGGRGRRDDGPDQRPAADDRSARR